MRTVVAADTLTNQQLRRYPPMQRILDVQSPFPKASEDWQAVIAARAANYHIVPGDTPLPPLLSEAPRDVSLMSYTFGSPQPGLAELLTLALIAPAAVCDALSSLACARIASPVRSEGTADNGGRRRRLHSRTSRCPTTRPCASRQARGWKVSTSPS